MRHIRFTLNMFLRHSLHVLWTIFLIASLITSNEWFTEKGLDHVAESILSYLDAKSLVSAELVCKEWHRVISEGMLWKKLIERKVRTDSVWRGLAERRGWWVATFIIYNLIKPLTNKHKYDMQRAFLRESTLLTCT